MKRHPFESIDLRAGEVLYMLFLCLHMLEGENVTYWHSGKCIYIYIIAIGLNYPSCGPCLVVDLLTWQSSGISRVRSNQLTF